MTSRCACGRSIAHRACQRCAEKQQVEDEGRTWARYFELVSREEVMPHHLRGEAERLRQWLIAHGGLGDEDRDSERLE